MKLWAYRRKGGSVKLNGSLPWRSKSAATSDLKSYLRWRYDQPGPHTSRQMRSPEEIKQTIANDWELIPYVVIPEAEHEANRSYALMYKDLCR